MRIVLLSSSSDDDDTASFLLLASFSSVLSSCVIRPFSVEAASSCGASFMAMDVCTATAM